MSSTDASEKQYPVYHGLRTAGPTAVLWAGFLAAPLVLALFLLVGLSALGFAYGLALFAANRLAAYLTDRAARGKMEVTAVGITGMGFITRAWVSVAALFALARLDSEDVALGAAVCFLALFTIDLLSRSLAALVAREGARATQETA